MLNKEKEELEILKSEIEKSNLFDKVFYLRTYQDVRVSDMSAIDHFVKYGLQEDRKPNAEFDPVWYREFYVDLKADETFSFIDYMLNGQKENKFKNEAEKNEYKKLKDDGFDIEFYKNSHEDLKQIKDEKFDFVFHYVRYGKSEDRQFKLLEKQKKRTNDEKIINVKENKTNHGKIIENIYNSKIENKESLEDNELLLEQLLQTQELLEEAYLETITEKQKKAKVEKERESLKQKLIETQKELLEENKLLLVQLLQTQESLEEVYLEKEAGIDILKKTEGKSK
jgi:hypothetical protein